MRVVLLTGSAGSAKARAAIASGEAEIAVGTHALIQRGVEFADLAVAVVDEQHRFGVEQRQALAEACAPHVLHMTATPIPRTLALTVYGDLDVTRDREAAREPQADRDAPGSARSARARRTSGCACTSTPGRQAYVVCPLIEASETRLARAAEEEAERLQRAELSGLPGRAAARPAQGAPSGAR